MSISTTADTTRTAEEAIQAGNVTVITSTNYNANNARKIKHTMTNATHTVPSYVRGGSYGHIVLLKTNAEYNTCTGGTGYTKVTSPVALDFTGITT